MLKQGWRWLQSDCGGVKGTRCQVPAHTLPDAEAVRELDLGHQFSTHCQTAERRRSRTVTLPLHLSPKPPRPEPSTSAFMDVASLELKGDVTQWDENEVHAWFTTLGYPQYGNQIKGQ